MIRTLKSRDLKNFIHYCSQTDDHSDFYIVKNNERVFLSDPKASKKVFNNCLKCADKCLIYEENNEIKGILILTGFVDKFHQKHLKIFTDNNNTISNLLKALNWYYNCNLYIQIKQDNPIAEVLLGTRKYNSYFRKNLNTNRFRGFGFRIKEKQEKEVLLIREHNPKFTYQKRDKK